MFYYNGINFCLRGGAEHRDLHESQLDFGSDSASGKPFEFVDYTEHGSKNRPGGRKQLNLDNKIVQQYAQPASGERCHVHLLKVYLSKLPPAVDQPRKAFYYKPLTNCSPTDATWFSSVPVGHNTLKGMLKCIFVSAGLDNSNRSLRATLISRMYEANVAEKIIMERSGHISKDGVRSYEKQVKSVCTILAPINENTVDSQENNQDFLRSEPQTTDIKPISVLELLKPLNFQQVTGCTFNISLNLK